MNKKIIYISILFLLILIVYILQDGVVIYKVQKKLFSNLGLINYYSSLKFSDNTIIENFKFKNDFDAEVLRATLLVPNDDIGLIFEDKFRLYEIGDIEKEKYEDPIYFKYIMFNRVRRFNITTQRDTIFYVGYPGEEYTKVYVYIDYLGWWRTDKLKLGGVD